MMEKCAICGKDADYFTDTYDPLFEVRHYYLLCSIHQESVCRSIIRKMKKLQKQEAGA